MFQFIALYGGYYYKCHYFYIFTIQFLFSFTQFYPLFFILSINHHYFSSVYLSVVAVSVFVFVCVRCWYLCACQGSGLVSLSPCFIEAIDTFMLVCQCFGLILSYFWCRIAVIWLLSLVCLPVYGYCWCPYCFCDCH